MNIQIFGRGKCFETKKAERYFKERRVSFQSIDLPKKGMSAGELRNIKAAVGSLDALIDTQAKGYAESTLAYAPSVQAKEAILLEQPQFFKTPIVRNSKQATVGYKPEVWKQWE